MFSLKSYLPYSRCVHRIFSWYRKCRYNRAALQSVKSSASTDEKGRQQYGLAKDNATTCSLHGHGDQISFGELRGNRSGVLAIGQTFSQKNGSQLEHKKFEQIWRKVLTRPFRFECVRLRVVVRVRGEKSREGRNYDNDNREEVSQSNRVNWLFLRNRFLFN